MGTDKREDWGSRTIEELMGHIVEKHHAFCRTELERFGPLIDEVLRTHGDRHPELRQLKAVFASMSADLKLHLVKEEQTLFPYIARLEQAVAGRKTFSRPPYGTVANPIRFMILEHEKSDAQLNEIRELSRDFEAPPDGDAAFQALYTALREFEADMKTHTLLEDDMLFPRAIALEKAADSHTEIPVNRKGNV
jgi:regulator of cell morphogenesis and NO signaling